MATRQVQFCDGCNEPIDNPRRGVLICLPIRGQLHEAKDAPKLSVMVKFHQDTAIVNAELPDLCDPCLTRVVEMLRVALR